MQFSVGDKVLFKKDNLRGKIIKINSYYKVTVLSLDGFEMHVSVKDLVKVEQGTDTATAYGEDFHSKDLKKEIIKSQKAQRHQSILKIDLHIELLTLHYHHMDNFEIVQLQLKECHKQIEKALNSNITKLEIVHGIGEGVLKSEVHKILRNYNLRYYLSRDGGSTEVFI
tara:strand:+ start:884 stop:1390 length:507 start_codon:yes stop_codon:yes gene_type:complete